ncbi:class I SAM-dependent methyltransferase [Candidatus Parcubacteria bacterium]|nr:class I SAM-dependent methyltransferase [Candidatus Parcubacteria bacterium]
MSDDSVVVRRNVNWLEEFGKVYSHPAVVFFRGLEARAISETLGNFKLFRPLLDLGCGEGRVGQVLFESQIDVGLDNSEGDLEKAAKVSKYLKLTLGDARNLPLESGSFRTVFSNCVVEHIPEIDLVLQEVSRVLKTGGFFIFTVPSEKFGKFLWGYQFLATLGLPAWAEKYSTLRNKQLSHFHTYSPETWQTYLDRDGLSIVECRRYVSSKSLSLWDRLAWVVFWLKLLTLNLTGEFWEKRVRRWSAPILQRAYAEESQTIKEGGAALLIVARKI